MKLTMVDANDLPQVSRMPKPVCTTLRLSGEDQQPAAAQY
jgi:hypothetical protein